MLLLQAITMQVGTHRIRRQRWQVKTTSATSAFALRQALRTQLDSVLLPAFERAFDALNSGDEVWHIPQFTLNLRLCDGEDLIAALATLIEQELAKVLRQVVVGAAVGTLHAAARRLAPEASRRQLLLEYLSTGRVAWHAGRQEIPNLVSLLRDAANDFAAEMQQADRQRIVHVLGSSLETRIESSFRLLQLLDPIPRAALLKQMAGDDSPDAPPLRAMLLRLIAAPRLGSYMPLRLAALLLSLRAEDWHPPLAVSVVSLLREYERQLSQVGITDVEVGVMLDALRAAMHSSEAQPSSKGESVPSAGHDLAARQIPRASSPSIPIPASRAETVESVEQAPRQDNPRDLPEQPSRVTIQGAAAHEDKLPTTGVETQAAASTSHDERMLAMQAAVAISGNDRVAEAADGFLVNDAGLILLHPFLPRLFLQVGIVPEGARRLDAEHLPRAAALLHWLVTAREEAFEFELLLIKVLLGLTPRDSLPVAGGLLSGDDRAEADALLAAAIEHWTALRSTSLAGLRGSYLQRRGLLYDGEHGWRLQVETEAFDMLLGLLPWGINVVKLPWMTRPIFTEWPTP